MEEVLYIKNMVCPRCIRVVKEDLEKLGITVEEVKLGEARIILNNSVDKNKLRKQLEKSGFELLEDKQIQLIEKVKTVVIDAIQTNPKPEGMNISEFIAKEVGKDYGIVSSLFSSHENQTLEKFIIQQKIEKVKELLVYEEFTLSEIAWKLEYSSVAHLSAQFKQVTGLTPSEFKKTKKGRKGLDEI
jgi:AraC-like DNA-binding protein